MNLIKRIKYILLSLGLALPLSLTAQTNTDDVLIFSKGDILASINLGYTGSERNSNFNDEFEKSFKRLNTNIQSFLFLSSHFGLGLSIGSENLEQRFVQDEVTIRNSNSFTYSLFAGYYNNLFVFDNNLIGYLEGGYLGIQEERWSRKNDYSGYVLATGVLYPINKKSFLNLKIKRIAYQREYRYTVVVDESVSTISEKEWPTDLSLSIGITIKF